MVLANINLSEKSLKSFLSYFQKLSPFKKSLIIIFFIVISLWIGKEIILPNFNFIVSSPGSFNVTGDENQITYMNEVKSKFGTTTTVHLGEEINLDNVATLTVIPPMTTIINNKNKWNNPASEIWLTTAPAQKIKVTNSTTSISVPVTVPEAQGERNWYSFLPGNRKVVQVGSKIYVVTLLHVNTFISDDFRDYSYTFGISEK